MATPLSGAFATPDQRPSRAQGIAAALSGFGAGVQGRGPEYVMAMQEQQEALSQERTQAMIQDALAVNSLLSQNNVDGAMQVMNKRVNLINQLGGDPSDTVEVMQLVQSGRLPEAQQLIGGFLGQAQAMGLYQPPQAQQIKAGDLTESGQAIFATPSGGVEARDVAGFRAPPEQALQEPGAIQALRIRAQEAGLQPGTQEYADFMRAGGSPAGVSVTTNVEAPGSDKYMEERAKAQAATMSELEKSAESAYRANQALDRFVAASASGAAGGAQPIITGVKNFLSSFGFDPAGLTDTAVMQQAVGDILGAKMAELGARGLTDKDMEILRQALPRVDISHEARVEVANIIKKANLNTLREYDQQVQFEEQTYPDMNFRRPSWIGDIRSQLQGAASEADPLGIL